MQIGAYRIEVKWTKAIIIIIIIIIGVDLGHVGGVGNEQCSSLSSE